jgi:hypothetical protein
MCVLRCPTGWCGLQGEGQGCVFTQLHHSLCIPFLTVCCVSAALLLCPAQVGVGYKVKGKMLSSSMPASIEDLEAAEVRHASNM